MIRVEWCGLCNAQPSQGTLRFDVGEEELVELQTCEKCAKGMADTAMINLSDITQ